MKHIYIVQNLPDCDAANEIANVRAATTLKMLITQSKLHQRPLLKTLL